MNDAPNQLDCRASTVLKLAWPMVASQSAIALMQLADLWMVSQLGATERQAIGTTALIALSVGTFGAGFLITAINAMVGQAHGRNQPSSTTALAWQGIWAATIIGFLVLALFPSAPYLFAALGHPLEVQQLEIKYVQISLFAVLPQLIGLTIGHYFLATRRPRYLMFGLFLSVLLNVAFNYAFIFGKLGFPELGFEGAAWGTLLANVANAAVMLFFFLFRNGNNSAQCRKPSWSSKDLRVMFRIGTPAGIQDMVEWGTLGILLMFLANRFGAEHLEASSILLRCIQMAVLPADGLGAAVMTLVANQIGAGRLGAAKEVALLGFRLTSIYMCVVAILFYLFRIPIMQLFTESESVVRIGSQLMICICLFQMFDAFTINYIHTLQGAGDSAWPSAVNITLVLIVMLGGGLAVLHFFPILQSFGIWSLAALLTGLQGLAFKLRWDHGPWQSIQLR